MADKDVLTAEEALERFGVSVHMKGMIPKGQTEVHEFRSAFRIPGGISSSLTVVVKSWIQSAHSHHHTCENTTVLKGQVVSIALTLGEIVAKAHLAGDSIRDYVGQQHTLYVTEGTVLSSAKRALNPYEGSDWHASPKLDEMLKDWDEARLLKAANITRGAFFR